MKTLWWIPALAVLAWVASPAPAQNKIEDLQKKLEQLKSKITPEQIEELKKKLELLKGKITPEQIDQLKKLVQQFQDKITPEKIDQLKKLVQGFKQGKGKGKGGFQFPLQPGGGQLRLLENADVQKDLKLSEDQVKKVGALAQKQKDALKDLKGKDRFAKMKELAESTKKSLGDLLTANQMNRLGQLELQQKGARAFLDKKIAENLGLKEEQTTKIKEALKESGKKTFELFKEAKGNFAEMQKKLAELNKSTTADIVKGLTEEQRKKWKEMAGEPFNGTLPPSGLFPGIIIQPLPGGNLPKLPFQKKKKSD